MGTCTCLRILLVDPRLLKPLFPFCLEVMEVSSPPLQCVGERVFGGGGCVPAGTLPPSYHWPPLYSAEAPRTPNQKVSVVTADKNIGNYLFSENIKDGSLIERMCQ